MSEVVVPDIWEAVIGSLFGDPKGIYEAGYLLEHPSYAAGNVASYIVQAFIASVVIQYLWRWWRKRKGAKDPKVSWNKSLLIGFVSLAYVNLFMALGKISSRAVTPLPGIIAYLMIAGTMIPVILLVFKGLSKKKTGG